MLLLPPLPPRPLRPSLPASLPAGSNYGYYAAAALFVVPTIRSLCDAHYQHMMFRLGVHVRDNQRYLTLAAHPGHSLL